MHHRFVLLAIAGALSCFPIPSLACSSCGCTLSSDWDSLGFATQPGFRFDLRFDYLDQAQLRQGSGAVDRSDLPLPQDFEVEDRTINRYTTLGFDYSPSADWAVNVQLPFVSRWHATTPEGENAFSRSSSNSIGDARVVLRYQGFTGQRNAGVQLGLKLPTGAHDQTFHAGTEAGEPLDRGLQPGTGTTDLIVGVYRFGPVNQAWDYFAQAVGQGALDASEHFRPGASLNLNVGLRYLASESVVPELQLNMRGSRRDSGAEADAENSGGVLLDLSPGINLKAGDNLHLFGFVQVPLYQRVNGYQLAPRYTASLGARFDFR